MTKSAHKQSIDERAELRRIANNNNDLAAADEEFLLRDGIRVRSQDRKPRLKSATIRGDNVQQRVVNSTIYNQEAGKGSIITFDSENRKVERHSVQPHYRASNFVTVQSRPTHPNSHLLKQADDYKDIHNPLQDGSQEFDLKNVSPNRISMGKRMSAAVPHNASMLPPNLITQEREGAHSDNMHETHDDRHLMEMEIEHDAHQVQEEESEGSMIYPPQTNIQIQPTLTTTNNKVAYDENDAIFDIIKD